ncbi:MAG: hypothetical protein HC923_01120 [Myxococcales bacterium]|nr:hypothetical protein [Myxococcales bacterium]
MRLVDIESPFAGDVQQNENYARAAMRDCLQRGEAPLASHLLYTQPGILRDDLPEERTLGMAAGDAWARHAEKTVVYYDLGITPGMHDGIADAYASGRIVEYRSLKDWRR